MRAGRSGAPRLELTPPKLPAFAKASAGTRFAFLHDLTAVASCEGGCTQGVGLRTVAQGSWADPFRVCMCWAVLAMANAMPAASAATSTALKPVPAITFTNLDGAQVTLSSFRGSVVLVNFWGTWSAPCLESR